MNFDIEKNKCIERYHSKKSKWTYKIKVRKAALHEENNGENVKRFRKYITQE